MQVRQLRRQVRKRARDIVYTERGALVIQGGLIANVFGERVRLARADIDIKAGNIYKKSKESVRRDVDQMGIKQLPKEDGAQCAR